MTEVGAYVARAIAALVVVALFAIGAWLAVRRWAPWTGQRSSRHLELVDALPLGLHSRLLLVRVNERMFLLAATPQQVSLLSEMELSCTQDTSGLRDDHGSDHGN